MENNIVLSIVIPTYSRRSFLETTTESIIKQINGTNLADKIEVIIANDASTDDTADFVNQIPKIYNFVSGYNHQQNLGFSKNVEFLLDKARGEYILICGDDDVIKDGALKYIMKCIEDNKPNYILINTSNVLSLDNMNRDLKEIQKNRLKISEDIFVKNFAQDQNLLTVASNWLYLTNFITANVFRKDLFESELTNARKFIRAENAYAFQGPIIIGIAKYGKLMLISECFILHRKTEPNWAKDNQGIFVIDILDSTEISALIREYIPYEYKRYKKLLAAFILDDFIIETKKRLNKLNIRKFAWVAFYKHLDCFPENIKFLSVTLSPKFIAYVMPKLRSFKNFVRLN